MGIYFLNETSACASRTSSERVMNTCFILLDSFVKFYMTVQQLLRLPVTVAWSHVLFIYLVFYQFCQVLYDHRSVVFSGSSGFLHQ